MYYEIKKYTLDDMKYIDKILNAFCDKYTRHKTILHGKYGKYKISSKNPDMLKKEGLRIEVVEKFGYSAKKEVCGIPVEIVSLLRGSNDYKKGIQVMITCSGETKNSLQADVDRKEARFLRYLSDSGIPASRVCVGYGTRCEYKFCGPT